MVEGVEASYCRLLEIVKKPTQENWYERYSSGLRLDRVEQGLGGLWLLPPSSLQHGLIQIGPLTFGVLSPRSNLRS